MPEPLYDSYAEEKRRLEEQENEDRLSLLDFCLTVDEYREVSRGEQPAQVVQRRDAFYGRR